MEAVLSIPFHVFQLSYWIYGLALRPQWRWGLYQPIVFMDNGLALATYMAGAVVSAAGFVSGRLQIFRRQSRVVLLTALLGLLMTLNVAGNVYGVTIMLAFVLRPRRVGVLALALACLAVTYPALRMADQFPRDSLVALASSLVNDERARSLDGRFDEEEYVLNHIGDRLWFGWGTISRTPGALMFGEGETGIDGWWTIQLGSRGVGGVLLWYAMLGIPVFLGWRWMRRRRSHPEQALVAALMAIVAVRMVDLLINGWWNNLPVFLAGALYGVATNPPLLRLSAPHP
jgi:hypothetical protein